MKKYTSLAVLVVVGLLVVLVVALSGAPVSAQDEWNCYGTTTVNAEPPHWMTEQHFPLTHYVAAPVAKVVVTIVDWASGMFKIEVWSNEKIDDRIPVQIWLAKHGLELNMTCTEPTEPTATPAPPTATPVPAATVTATPVATATPDPGFYAVVKVYPFKGEGMFYRPEEGDVWVEIIQVRFLTKDGLEMTPNRVVDANGWRTFTFWNAEYADEEFQVEIATDDGHFTVKSSAFALFNGAHIPMYVNMKLLSRNDDCLRPIHPVATPTP